MMTTTTPQSSVLVPGATATLLRDIPTRDLIAEWAKKLQIDVTADIGSFDSIQMYRCDRTGLVFFRPPNAAGSGPLYAALQKFDWYYMPEKWEHRRALQDLQGFKKILEVGAGQGSFVAKLQQAGFDAVGYEINDDAVAAAQRAGIRVEALDLYDAADAHASEFDAACCFQVLEHIAEPRPFLEAIVKVIRTGGQCIFSVPNGDSYLTDTHGLLDMPPHHMTRWNAAAFRSLEKILPLKLTDLRAEPLAPYHVDLYVGAVTARARKHSPMLGKLAFNRITMPFYRRALKAGLRKQLTGHTLYARFTKI